MKSYCFYVGWIAIRASVGPRPTLHEDSVGTNCCAVRNQHRVELAESFSRFDVRCVEPGAGSIRRECPITSSCARRSTHRKRSATSMRKKNAPRDSEARRVGLNEYPIVTWNVTMLN